MIDSIREIDLPFILDRFKKVEPLQSISNSDIPEELDDKSKAIYSLIIDSISHAKDFSNIEIDNIADLLNNTITDIYKDFSEISFSINSLNDNALFTESLYVSMSIFETRLLTLLSDEYNQNETMSKVHDSLKALTELIVSFKESYDKYVNELLDSFKSNFSKERDLLEKRVDEEISKALEKKLNSLIDNNIRAKELLKKFNSKIKDIMISSIPNEITIMTHTMKRRLEKQAQEKKQQKSSLKKLLKDWGIIGFSIGLTARTFKVTAKTVVAATRSVRKLLSRDKKVRQAEKKRLVKKAKTTLKDIGAGIRGSLVDAREYLKESSFSDIQKNYGLVGSATALFVKMFSKRTLYASFKRTKKKPKKLSETDLNFKPMEFKKTEDIDKLAFRLYDLAELVRTNLINVDNDIVEEYKARKNGKKRKEKKEKLGKAIARTFKQSGLVGLLFSFVIKPLLNFIGRIGKSLFSIAKLYMKKFFDKTGISKLWKKTVGKAILNVRSIPLALKMIRAHKGVSVARALRLARIGKIMTRGSKVASTATKTSSGSLKFAGKAAPFLAFGIDFFEGINAANNKEYMTRLYGISEDQLTTKHKVFVILSATITGGGGSVIDDPSWSNFINLILNSAKWYAVLGQWGILVGVVTSLIGQERLARFFNKNPFTSLGSGIAAVTLKFAGFHPLGLSIASASIAAGFAIDWFTSGNAWSSATNIGRSVGMIVGGAGGIIAGLAIAGAFAAKGAGVGAGAGVLAGGVGAIPGAIIGALVGFTIGIFAGFFAGGWIGKLFDSNESEEENAKKIEEYKKRFRESIKVRLSNIERKHRIILPNVNASDDMPKKMRDSTNSLYVGMTRLDAISKSLIKDGYSLLYRYYQKPATINKENTTFVPVGVNTSRPIATRRNLAAEAAREDAERDLAMA